MPLWIPQLTMPIGIAAMCLALVKSILADLRPARTPDAVRADHPALTERAVGPELQIIFVFGVFLFLLVIGMSVPFAITVPSLVYIYLQGGLKGFNALGLVSWGSMNSFILTAIPLFILMAEIMLRSGLTTRVYQGLAQARVAHSGRAAADQHRSAARSSRRSAARASRPRPRSAASRCRSFSA